MLSKFNKICNSPDPAQSKSGPMLISALDYEVFSQEF